MVCLEDTLWTGTPGDYTNPEAPKSLAEVRKLVDNGQYAEATEAAVQLTDNSPDVRFLISLVFISHHVFVLCLHQSTFNGLVLIFGIK